MVKIGRKFKQKQKLSPWPTTGRSAPQTQECLLSPLEYSPQTQECLLSPLEYNEDGCPCPIPKSLYAFQQEPTHETRKSATDSPSEIPFVVYF